MNHESNKSPSLGMISAATRTTATVSPLSPLTNGNTVAQSANSGFAAALRKLAKQAEDPRGAALSGESSPVSSPATSHTSPVTTPKRGSLGPLLGQTRGHGVPGTPPVVTIAPTKTSNGLWRADGRQVEPSVQGLSRERVGAENTQPRQDNRTPPTPSHHPLAHTFGLTPSSIMQDPRLQSLSLPGQMHPVVPSGAVPEEYLRALRPFTTSDDLRLTSLPMSLDPAAAAHAAAAAYYHPAYLHHPLSLPRMEESLCLSALRSQFYSVPAGGTFPPLHHSALHLHLPGGRYPGELNHAALAERLQMENELRQRERQQEREREKEREREAGLEREREREREEERGRERERELDRQKVRQRERQQQMVRAAESHYLAELQARRAPPEDRARPGERLTPNRLDKTKDSEHLGFTTPKPLSVQPNLHSSRGSIPHPVPSLVPSHLGKHHTAAAGGIHGALAAAMMTQRASESVWLARQRGQDREGPMEMGLRSPGKGVEQRRDTHRTSSVHHNPSSKDVPPLLGAPPPLISPKGPHHPPAPPTTLWNPAALVDTSTDSSRKRNPPTPPSRPPPGLTRAERPPLSWGEKLEEGGKRGPESTDMFTSLRGASLKETGSWSRAEQERAIQSLYQRHHINNLHQRPCAPPSVHSSCTDQAASPSPARERQSQPSKSMLVYDEVLQQHRLLLSKLDLEEKRRKEAREGGYYYDLDESYDDSDEEEVKAHLRRVTEQPPLKLDTSSQKVEFLGLCGLTTLAHRDELLARKKRKRRRMMRERSVSPPAVQGKRKSSSPVIPSVSLTTPYSAEQMDSAPELEDKKDFLLTLNLSHVNPQKRRDKERTEELLKAIQRKTVTLDTLRYNPLPLSSSPSAPSSGDFSSATPSCQSNGHLYPDSPSPSPPHLYKPRHLHHNDTFKSSVDSHVTRIPPPPTLHQEKAELTDKKLQGIQNEVAASPQKKELNPVQNGRSRPSERFTPETFAQHFHQAVLQSTHSTQHNKEFSNIISEAGIKSGRSLPLNIAQLKNSNHNHVPQQAQINGHHFHYPAASRNSPGALENQFDDDEEEESDQEGEEEEEEIEEAPRKWQGIESIFEAFQEYADDWSIERQVLHSQCKRLESQNYNLTRAAEQLSLTMGDLVSQRQRVREERERLQAQLEHFRRCLTLPNIHWGRGQVNGHTPR
ncbi:genetic suppressor element 1-like [Notolabrus celidotus]|uniref:genetic suppressor element 1-like n=1 Tax=Notolabrus celidotus TaxID=1203425 RepID=UPI00148FEF63|nr:genetic suppressor element 1-like [Notolabrus celidotus]XP_034540839.1 genetic suppressor element 1-like [Notolabrus celidotus]XP_034540840.1 genetic suppressor element 1-like [Notolabrus celidotus]